LPRSRDLARDGCLTVLAIFGPTASGKSAVAEEIARRIPAEVVSADSMQVYRGLPILTNQSPARLVGIWELDYEASVGEYQQLAHTVIDEILGSGRTPIVVGGTGLYLRAALADLELPPAAAPETREGVERLYDRLGAERAHELLAERDPAAAGAVHPNDRRRVVRALELAEVGSSLRPSEDRLWAGETRHSTLIVGLDLPREELRRRIAERARTMFERGVEEEVRAALEGRISTTARHVHGLREIAELPREQALETLIARSRRYAVYQLRWMRRIPGIVSLDGQRPPGELADAILEMARSRERLPARRAGGAGRPADA
jgi:tRNA dimethylallyltransferase